VGGKVVIITVSLVSIDRIIASYQIFASLNPYPQRKKVANSAEVMPGGMPED